jgi:osmoprotectant transport system permease protein
MSLFTDALAWLFSPERLQGQYALPVLLGQHVFYALLSVFVAAVIAIPVGWFIGHTGHGRELAVAISGAARAIPAFGLMLLLVLLLGFVRTLEAAVVSFVLLAIPPLLAGAYTGLQAIDRGVIDAARGVGMTGWQVFWKVEAPLGLPLLVGGMRSALLQVIATVTIAAYINLGGLGWPIIQGIPLRRFDQVLAGAVLVVLLALVVDLLMAAAQCAAVPKGLGLAGSPGLRRTTRTTSRSPQHAY